MQRRSKRWRPRSPRSTACRPKRATSRARWSIACRGHTSALAEVARDLAAKQQTIDLALQSRHDSLQSLFAEIGEKSQEFDAVARHFAASFEESFAKAQTRAQEISASLTVATKNAAASVAGQFEMIRDNAGKEREKTARGAAGGLRTGQCAARRGHDEDGRSVPAIGRRSQADGGRGAAPARRRPARKCAAACWNCPTETTEAANAMRRVVSDQIKALKELTAVVAASGGDFDVAEPTPRQPSTSRRRAKRSRLARSSRRRARTMSDC